MKLNVACAQISRVCPVLGLFRAVRQSFPTTGANFCGFPADVFRAIGFQNVSPEVSNLLNPIPILLVVGRSQKIVE